LQSHELSENPTLSETAEAMQAQIEHIFNELRLAAK
jgi:hypothetical protein